MENPNLAPVSLQPLKGSYYRLDAALGVRLDDDVEFLGLTRL